MAFKVYTLPIIVILFTTAAFVLSRYASNWCWYLNRNAGSGSTVVTSGTNVDGSLNETVLLGLPRSYGIWSFEALDSSGQWNCYGHNSFPAGFEYDAMWNAARSFTIITAVLGGCSMITAWFSLCLPIRSKHWKLIGLTLLVTSAFEGLTLLMFRTNLCQDTYSSELFGTFEPDCNLNSGARCNISATVFWFVAAVVCMKIPEPTLEPIVEKEAVVTTETVQPDGTRGVQTETMTDQA